jgi:hypothetical protein
MAKKKVRKSLIPATSKQPRISPTIKNPMNLNPVWHVGTLDIYGPWGWSDIEKNVFFSEILPKLQNFESMFWKDILGRNSHEVPVADISTTAQKRLEQLNLDDTETITSIRLTGKQRIWGVRVENILRVLWWDPEHRVYPSQLEHT